MDIRTPVPTIYGDWLQKFGEAWNAQVKALQVRFGDSIEEIRMPGAYPTDVPIVFVKRSAIIEVLRFAKSETAFDYNFLADITATDEETDPRFEIVYNLYSMAHHWRIRFKVRCPENEEVPTAISLWKAANWAEREIFDMFGVKFAGHPDLRRILMDERWIGHPLRKDYPLKGYQLFPTPMEARPELLE